MECWNPGSYRCFPEASLRPGCRLSMPARRRSLFSSSVGERKLMKHFVVQIFKLFLISGPSTLTQGLALNIFWRQPGSGNKIFQIQVVEHILGNSVLGSKT